MGYSDFQLHRFALAHPKRFGGYALDAARLQDGGKCALLAELLPRLQVPLLPLSLLPLSNIEHFAACNVLQALLTCSEGYLACNCCERVTEG